MLASKLVSLGEITVIEIPKPEMKPGEVLVRLEIGTICGSDLHYFRHGFPGVGLPYPAGFSGHEIVGIVEDSDSAQFQIGDRVLIVPLAPPDGFTQWIVLPPTNLVKLPNSPGLDELVIGQQLGTVIHATRRFPNVSGWDVVVLGQGPAGLMFDMLLAKMGARKVIGIDVVPHRLEVARKVGATHVIDAGQRDPIEAVAEITDGKLGDMAVEAVGKPETYNRMVDLIREEGFISIFGVPPYGDGWEFAFEKFFRKQATTIATSHTEKEPGYTSFNLAMSMISEGRVDVRPLISHRIPLANIDKAYYLAETKQDGAVKVLLELQ